MRRKTLRRVGRVFGVPVSILDKIDAKCSSEEEKISAVVNYVVTIVPCFTWEDIAARLYMEDEEEAVERVKPYLHTLPGGSCFKSHNINIV